jgi:hypothetical protein
VRTLVTITFIYEKREDRVLAAMNAGRPDAWSCWLTRRLALAVLTRGAEYLQSTSSMTQQAPADLRGDFIAFEREAAIASTEKSMSKTPDEVLKLSVTGAELADRLVISRQGDRFRLELHGQQDSGAGGVLKRAELQRVLQMLQSEVAKAGWLDTPTKPQVTPVEAVRELKPVRH